MTSRRICLPVLAFAAILGVGMPAAAGPSEDAESVFRSVAQAHRNGRIPPPPPGVSDLRWSDLSPRGWDARGALRRWVIADTEHDEARIRAAATSIRAEWDRAPTVRPQPTGSVRLIAFAVPLGGGKEPTTKVILSPYTIVSTLFDGDGNITLMPPANQMVFVTLNRPVPTAMLRYPVWVTGQISAVPTSTRHGRVAYRMTDASWEPYPYQEYPLQQYQWPR
jgi:hypothetical protein